MSITEILNSECQIIVRQATEAIEKITNEAEAKIELAFREGVRKGYVRGLSDGAKVRDE